MFFVTFDFPTAVKQQQDNHVIASHVASVFENVDLEHLVFLFQYDRVNQ